MCDKDHKWKFCDKCGCKKVMKEEEPICPKCNGLDILPKTEALKIFDMLYDWFNQQVAIMVKALNKTELIFWLLEERVILASLFFNGYPSISLTRLFALNDLLRRTFKAYNVKGNEKADYEKAMQLIDQYSSVISYVNISHYLIEEEYAHCVLKKPFELQSVKQSELFPNDLISSFRYYLDVDWININKSLELNMILTDEATEKYLNEHKEEYHQVNNSTKKIVFTPEQRIQNLYPTLKSLYDGLLMNTFFAELFDIRYLKEKKIPVEVFLTIAKCPTRTNGMLLYTSRKEFIRYLTEEIKDFNPEDIYKSFVFSENNQGIFPFVVEIEGNIFLSPNFLNLMELYYTTIYYRDTLFKKETDRRSNLFQLVEVPNKLKENGFKVRNDIQDRDKKNELQIDSIARKGNKVYVIETKLWDIGKLFVRKKTHLQRERDLKGVVDGFEYSTNKDGSTDKEKRPSLLRKIDYVNQNLKTLCPDYEMITNVEGLIITRSYPPIAEYKGVKILSIEEIRVL